MPADNFKNVLTKSPNVFLRVSKGHFATGHSHINYYIDVTMPKTRLSEASAVAKELASYYNSNTIVDTILCLDGMEVVGTCLAEELTKSNFRSINAHQTIYVVTPERTTGSQLFFRDNIAPMITGKNVLILAASVTTGYTASAAFEAIEYYNGTVAGICAIFSTQERCAGREVKSIFNPNDLYDYVSHPASNCPMCQRGEKIQALVNSHGFSKL